MDNKNYCVIMGGGVGSRFWPLSRENNPKQFLDLLGVGKSLLQMTFDRFSKIVPADNIIIVTNETYKDKVLEQLPQIKESNVLLEPMRRNTAPCIAYACYHISHFCPDANIVVTPSDHLILDEANFVDSINKSLSFVENNDNIVTLGVKPLRPETGYGYIQMKNPSTSKEITEVKTFTEKPDIEMAKVFVSSGEFLWNSGMFVWNMHTIMNAFREFIPEITQVMNNGKEAFGTDEEQTFINDNFKLCPSISIDYGVIEKADNVMVLPVDFGWADLGTWGSIYELSDKDENNNVSISTNTIFRNSSGNIVSSKEKDKLIVINGIDDCIISESDNVLLICRKDDEQQIKQLVTETLMRYDKKYI